jgi:hypothetical protein
LAAGGEHGQFEGFSYAGADKCDRGSGVQLTREVDGALLAKEFEEVGCVLKLNSRV